MKPPCLHGFQYLQKKEKNDIYNLQFTKPPCLHGFQSFQKRKKHDICNSTNANIRWRGNMKFVAFGFIQISQIELLWSVH